MPKYKLYNEDCLAIMKTMPENYIDLTVTSPPYDGRRDYGKSLEWDFSIFKKIAKELFRVTKEGGVVVWVVNDETKEGSESGTSFRQALYFKKIGFNLHDTMIYKNMGFHTPTIDTFKILSICLFFLKVRLKHLTKLKLLQ